MNERHDDEQDDWDDDADDDDGWADGDTVTCFACGEGVYEDAIRCPSCGEYVTHRTSLFAGRPWWWIALGIAGVVAVIVTSIVIGLGL